MEAICRAPPRTRDALLVLVARTHAVARRRLTPFPLAARTGGRACVAVRAALPAAPSVGEGVGVGGLELLVLGVVCRGVVPVSGLGRRSAALGAHWRAAGGWKRLGPLTRIGRGALGRGCGREGSGAPPLPRAAVISTRLRVQALRRTAAPAGWKQRQYDGGRRGTHDEQRGGHGDLSARYVRCAVRTVRPRLVRVPSTYCTWGPRGKPPCASGTYPTREAGTRSPYVPSGGPGAYVSAQTETTVAPRLCSAGGR